MKRILFIALVLFTSFSVFTGCKKDSSNPSGSGVSIVGKWNFKSDLVNIYTNGVITGGGQEFTYTNGEYIQFNSDGTGRDYQKTFTYKLKDNVLTVNFAAYTENGVTYDAETSEATVKELSNNKLTLYFNFLTKGTDGKLNGNEVTEYLTK